MTSRPSTSSSKPGSANGDKAPDRLPLLPKTVQDLPPSTPNEERSEGDLYGFNYIHNNLSTPVSPKQLSETDNVGDGLEAAGNLGHGETTPLLSASTVPPLRSGLHSFPPAFGPNGGQLQDHEDGNGPHNFWDMLCHCIESLTNAGTLGVVGAVLILIVFITTWSSAIPGVPWAGHGNGGGIAGSIQGLEDRFAQALQKSASANLTRIALGGVSDSQITVYVGAQVSFDYGRAEDAMAAWLLRAAGGTVGSISVAESAAQVYVKQEEEKGEGDGEDPYKLAFVAHAPPIDEFYLREGVITNLSMGINLTSFDRPGLLTDIAKRLLLGDPIPVRLTTVIRLHKWMIPLGSYPVTIEAIINEKDNSAFKDFDKVKLAELEIQANGGKRLDFAARLQSEFRPPISAHVPQINWDVAIPGCDYPERQHDVVTVTSVHSLAVDVNPRESVEVEVAAAIKKISDRIGEVCPGTGHSVLDKLLQDYLAGEATHLVVKGSCEQSSGLPFWVGEMLQIVQVPVAIPPKGAEGNETRLVEEITFSGMKIQFPPPRSPFDPSPGRPQAPPKISGHVAVTLEPPRVLNLTEDIGLGVDLIRGHANLISTETGVLFARLNISEWMESTTKAKHGEEGFIEYVVEFDLEGVPLSVVDERTLSGIATQFVMRGEAAVTFDAVVDVHLATPVGSFGLNQIPVKGDTIMKT